MRSFRLALSEWTNVLSTELSQRERQSIPAKKDLKHILVFWVEKVSLFWLQEAGWQRKKGRINFN